MLPQVDASGRVYAVANGVPVSWNSGVGYDSTGRMCTTTVLGATDQSVGGWRLDPLGRVVVAAQDASVVYNGGLPFNSDGSLARQIDTVPAANDPYVGGIRVGPAGGVYFTTAAPPVVLDSFSDDFSEAFE